MWSGPTETCGPSVCRRPFAVNYFAHGVRFVEDPYRLAGTALPDWLAVVRRRVRIRQRHLSRCSAGPGTPLQRLTEGVRQHLDDDDWFHRTEAFLVVSSRLGRIAAEFVDAHMPDPDRVRCGFLGHLLTEMLLDSVLIERFPQRLEEYYRALRTVDPCLIRDAFMHWGLPPVFELPAWIPIFVSEAILYDYLEPHTLLYRINQVMRRVRQPKLPGGFVEILQRGRLIVADQLDRLLPASRWGEA
ncbi:MAG: hypothetical protein D6725_12215 [Planctomycetota bacterium]|nr:MAG: hypothetical protein D6725_12215 [Planctomycetota bacterium]